MKTECDIIRYVGNLRWNDLKSCSDYDGNKLMNIYSDDHWINMNGIFYVTVLSPYSMVSDTGIYYEKQLISHSFQISIQKSLHILNSVGLNMFLLTIISAKPIFEYEDNTNYRGGYQLILQSQSLDYLQLKDPNLLRYPEQYDSWTIDKHLNALNTSCLFDANSICIQFWMIHIHSLQCPLIFDGEFDIEWIAECNPNNNDNMECNQFLADYGNSVTLSFDHSDRFDCNVMNRTNVFIQISSLTLYDDAIDRIEIEIFINELSATFNIDDYKASLLNVWICSLLNNNDTLQIIEDDPIHSGCFDSSKVDPDSLNAIILNGNSLSLNATIINNNASKEVLKFTFMAPNTFSYTKLFIHSEIKMEINETTNPKRRMLMSSNVNTKYNFVHNLQSIQIDSKQLGVDNKNNNINDNSYSFILFIVLGILILCICICGMWLFCTICKKIKFKLEHIDNDDISMDD